MKRRGGGGLYGNFVSANQGLENKAYRYTGLPDFKVYLFQIAAKLYEFLPLWFSKHLNQCLLVVSSECIELNDRYTTQFF